MTMHISYDLAMGFIELRKTAQTTPKAAPLIRYIIRLAEPWQPTALRHRHAT